MSARSRLHPWFRDSTASERAIRIRAEMDMDDRLNSLLRRGNLRIVPSPTLLGFPVVWKGDTQDCFP